MAAKTQDAAGETGVPCSHPHGYNAMGCCFTCGVKIAQSISEYGGIAATPRETALAAPTGEAEEGSAVAKLRELADMVNGPLAPALGDVVLDSRVAEMYVGLANEILSAVETLAAPSAPQEQCEICDGGGFVQCGEVPGDDRECSKCSGLGRVAAPQEPRGEPVAWAYELARSIMPDGTYTNWSPPQLSFDKPNVPEGSIRNLMRLVPQEPRGEPSEGEMPDTITGILDTLDAQELRNHASSTGATWRVNREVARAELVRRADALLRAMAEWIGASHHHDKCGNRWGQKCDCGRHSLLTREDEFRALPTGGRDAD